MTRFALCLLCCAVLCATTAAGETTTEEEPAPEVAEAPGADYVLVARELSIVDMFTLANEHVKGIVTEEGGLVQ